MPLFKLRRDYPAGDIFSLTGAAIRCRLSALRRGGILPPWFYKVLLDNRLIWVTIIEPVP